jgi:lysophospholipase L1-like esterase
VFLQIGGNDFSGDNTTDHMDVVFHIIQLARRIKSHPSVKLVHFGKLFYREFNSRFLPSPSHVENYNHKVDDVNQLLYEVSGTLERAGIQVRNHKGRVTMRAEIIGPDGTHLNSLGMKIFYRSIRGALISSKQILSGDQFLSN